MNITSWKNPELRDTLVSSPAGLIEINDELLLDIDGGSSYPTYGGCVTDQGYTCHGGDSKGNACML